MSQKFNSFQNFGNLLTAHRKPATRFCHYVATVIGVGFALGGFWDLVANATRHSFGYSMAVASHPLIEGNKALVGSHAVWAAISDLKMFGLAASGRLEAELVKHGIKKG